MKSLILASASAVLLVGVSTYFVAGAAGTSGANNPHPAIVSSVPASTTTAMNLASVESMVGGLEDKLRTNPNDGKAWLLLAKSYRHMGRMDDARNAYRKAEALGSGDATVARQLSGLEGTEAFR